MIEGISMVLIPAITFFLGFVIGHIQARKYDGYFVVEDLDDDRYKVTVDLKDDLEDVRKKNRVVFRVFNKD